MEVGILDVRRWLAVGISILFFSLVSMSVDSEISFEVLVGASMSNDSQECRARHRVVALCRQIPRRFRSAGNCTLLHVLVVIRRPVGIGEPQIFLLTLITWLKIASIGS